MKKIIILAFILTAFVETSFSQHTFAYSNPDVLFNQGKELFAQRKYAASFRSFEEFLKLSLINSSGQKQESEYYMAADAYELRQSDALMLLEKYLLQHPYTPFYDRVQLMLGMLSYEKKDFSSALKYFNEVKESRLYKRERVDFLFCKGYACLETKNYRAGLDIFKDLKNSNTRYSLSASYYYAYTEYCLGNYVVALPEFLKIEDNPAYSKIVPYYILQIYYAQKDYDKLNERGEALLKNNPTNKNNAEIYRIIGEIAYRDRNYSKAIENLKNYERIFPQVLRNDMYLLGLSYYQTQDYTNAIRYLSKVTNSSDEMTENSYMHLGNSYIRLNDKVNAKLAFEASLKTNFNKSVHEEAMFNYALSTYDSTSSFGESIKAFEQLLTEFPNTKYRDKALDYLSTVYLTTKNYEAAYQSILKIKKPSNKLLETKQYLLYQLGTEAFTQNNLSKAIEYFSLSLESSTTAKYSAECYYWRSESYFRNNQPKQSIADLIAFFNNANSKTSTNEVKAQYALAYAYFSEKRFSEALSWYLKYTTAETNKKSASYADVMNRIGDCYFYARDFAKAESFYSKAALLSPSSADYSLFQSAYVSGLQKNYNLKIEKIENLIKEFPSSEYADNALYEMGRAYLIMDNDSKAISSFRRLLDAYPKSDQARKAALEIGMIHFNNKENDLAISSFKQVISKYPGSEESYIALETLENVYIEINDVSAYIAYTKTLGRTISTKTSNREDSISFIAAEKQYINKKYEQAISGLKSFQNKFCTGSKYCLTAQYYLADSYYQLKDQGNALIAYKALLKMGGNQYTEEAIIRCAEISYDTKQYTEALQYFKQLQSIAQSTENRNVARLGILRCSYFLNDNQTTITIANEIIWDKHSNTELVDEARYNRAKAYYASGQLAAAIADFKILALDTRTKNGAESKYLVANLYFEQVKYDSAENEILDFAKKNTAHQYWLARSFVLLSDIYIKKEDDFQAKQYLLSLQNNYSIQDEIQTMITDRLKAINERESLKVLK